jgi:threonine dehydratase
VSDKETLHAMKYIWEHNKLVVEPGGATALAALMSGKLESYLEGTCKERPLNVCLVLSGGNVDADVFMQALSV